MPVVDHAPKFKIMGFEFGGRNTGVFVTDFDPGQGDVRIQDAERPGRSGLMFGRDYPSAPAWVFELTTDAKDAAGALDIVKRMADIWRDPRWGTPGTVAALTYSVAGRTRRVYGRPRRFSPPNGDIFTQLGRSDFLCDFQLTDPRTFDDTTTEITLTLIPESTGGIIFPLVFPMTTTITGGERAGFVTNTGSAPAPVTVTFYGPVTNPRVFTDTWEIGVTGKLAYDEQITVDALAGTVVNQMGAAVGGRLTRRTRLKNAELQPGKHEVKFTGADATGTAKATIAWRGASWSF